MLKRWKYSQKRWIKKWMQQKIGRTWSTGLWAKLYMFMSWSSCGPSPLWRWTGRAYWKTWEGEGSAIYFQHQPQYVGIIEWFFLENMLSNCTSQSLGWLTWLYRNNDSRRPCRRGSRWFCGQDVLGRRVGSCGYCQMYMSQCWYLRGWSFVALDLKMLVLFSRQTDWSPHIISPFHGPPSVSSVLLPWWKSDLWWLVLSLYGAGLCKEVCFYISWECLFSQGVWTPLFWRFGWKVREYFGHHEGMVSRLRAPLPHRKIWTCAYIFLGRWDSWCGSIVCICVVWFLRIGHGRPVT